MDDSSEHMTNDAGLLNDKIDGILYQHTVDIHEKCNRTDLDMQQCFAECKLEDMQHGSADCNKEDVQHGSADCSREDVQHGSADCSREDVQHGSADCNKEDMQHGSADCSREDVQHGSADSSGEDVQHGSADCNKEDMQHGSADCSREDMQHGSADCKEDVQHDVNNHGGNDNDDDDGKSDDDGNDDDDYDDDYYDDDYDVNSNYGGDYDGDDADDEEEGISCHFLNHNILDVWMGKTTNESETGKPNNALPTYLSLTNLVTIHSRLNQRDCEELKRQIKMLTDRGLIQFVDTEGNTLLLSWVKLMIKDSCSPIQNKCPERSLLQHKVLTALLQSGCDPNIPDHADNTVLSLVASHGEQCFSSLDLMSYPSITSAIQKSNHTGELQRFLRSKCDSSPDSLHLLKIVLNNGKCDLHNCFYQDVTTSNIIFKSLNILDKHMFAYIPVTADAALTPSHTASVCESLYKLGCDIPSEHWLLRAPLENALYRLEASLKLLPLISETRSLQEFCQIAILKALKYCNRSLADSLQQLKLPKAYKDELRNLLQVHHSLLPYKEIMLYEYNLDEYAESVKSPERHLEGQNSDSSDYESP